MPLTTRHAPPVGLAALSCATSLLGAGAYHPLPADTTPTGASNCTNRVVVGAAGSQFFTWTIADGVQLVGGHAGAGRARISDDGTRFSGSALNPTSGFHEIGRYDISTGAWTTFGGFGPPCALELSRGQGISGNGQSIVGLGAVSCSMAHALHWDGVALIDLGTTVPGRTTFAYGCSFDGSIVAGRQDSATGFHQGAIWSGGIQTLMTFAGSGAPAGDALDLSADGAVVVGAGEAGNGFQAWRWTGATNCVSLGTIFPADWRGASTAVSGDGETVVGYYRPFPGPAALGEGFIWTSADGMRSLTEHVIALGIPLPRGVILSLPLDISADGRTIVGQARIGDAVSGFVVTLTQACGCPGDFTGDGVVDAADLGLLIAAWGESGVVEDLNMDGVVDGGDLGALLGLWGPCP